ncbi:helix-turn-helix protein [Paramicrobacterium agarici]|nr:helix-turn-helix protein [Microbacterium agarici]
MTSIATTDFTPMGTSSSRRMDTFDSKVPTQPKTDHAVRVSMDRRVVVNSILAITLVLGLCSFAAGAPALYEVATWSRVPGVILPALFPVALDGSIIAFVAIRAIKRHRQESAVWSGIAVAALTLISLSLQVLHVLGSVTAPSIQDYVGAGAAALYPALVWLLTEAVLDVITEPTPKRAARRDSRRAGTPRRRSASSRPTSRPRPMEASGKESPSTRSAVKAGDGAAASRARAGDGAPRRSPSKIDDATRAEAIQRVRSGESQRAVAEALGVSRGALQNWLRQAEA